MFNFIKKAGTGTTFDKDDKDKRKREKKEKRDKQKRDRSSLSTEEILRLDEVRKSLKIGRRKEKEKLPSGITADYTADFLASLERDGQTSYSIQDSPSHTSHFQDGYTQSDSSETSLNSLNHQNQRIPPALPPKPPKRGILKTPKIVRTSENGNFDALDHVDLARNTLQNEVIEYQNLQNGRMNGKNMSDQLMVVTSTSPSGDSFSDTTNSSFATPPFSLSPVGESQGFHRKK
ncbi:hypothetical protein HHI36_022245 [Cryptolaemus montrouzieri]|uniref:Uncharacterized protein n=1 Tax=Cryptolaemus montrouzieri TaxID=559131 RepID=A0ABD2N002_9CUCU